MNPDLRELFRHELLRQLAQSAPLSLRVNALRVLATARGFTCTDREVEAELDYLRDKGLAALSDKRISPELLEYRITSDGRDYCATKGLA